jgi:hypothetical protein
MSCTVNNNDIINSKIDNDINVTVYYVDEIIDINNIYKTCDSLVIINNKLEKCKNINGNELYCNQHEYMNNISKNVIECCICFEYVDKQLEIPLNCGHLFHKNCLQLNNKLLCPLCRKHLTEIEIEYIKYNEKTIIQSVQNDTTNINNIRNQYSCYDYFTFKKVIILSFIFFSITLLLFGSYFL